MTSSGSPHPDAASPSDGMSHILLPDSADHVLAADAGLGDRLATVVVPSLPSCHATHVARASGRRRRCANIRGRSTADSSDQ